jgi:hypothetical protein
MCMVAIALLTIGFRLALSSTLRHPEPSAHDEFAYLLGADIIAHGRVAEPPHRLWKFFESVHVLSRPVYAPKYPPAQSVFLALGQVLFHDPFYGVLISAAMFSAAIYWMLRAYVAPPWALLGGICTSFYFGAGHYWTETYWGGAVAGFGAALIIGAFGRLVRRQNPYFALAFGAGALVLMNSRPYESSVLIVVQFAMLAAFCWSKRDRLALRVIVLTVASLGAALLLMLIYNHAVTGNGLKMPYTLYVEQHSTYPLFWFMHPSAPKHYENAGIESSYQRFEAMNWRKFARFQHSAAHGRTY